MLSSYDKRESVRAQGCWCVQLVDLEDKMSSRLIITIQRLGWLIHARASVSPKRRDACYMCEQASGVFSLEGPSCMLTSN